MTELLESLSSFGSEPTMARVREVEMAFNQFVNLANPHFIANPPPEFLALHAVLLRVGTAAGTVRSQCTSSGHFRQGLALRLSCRAAA